MLFYLFNQETKIVNSLYFLKRQFIISYNMENQKLDIKVTNELKLQKSEKNIIGSNIFPALSYHKSLNDLEKCICRITIDNKIFGTGFLLKSTKGKDIFYFLITCEHIITKQFIKDKKVIEIGYNYINENNYKINIQLNGDVRFIREYTYLDVDATVVQIFPEKKEIEKDYFYEIKNIDILNNYETFKGNNIHILQFPGGENILSYSQGKYLDKFNINGFYHAASTEGGSSGSPIFILNNNEIIIFGIHKAALDDDDKNVGNFIFPIIDSLNRNSVYEESTIFRGEIIDEYDQKEQCTTKGELNLEKKVCTTKGDLSLDKEQCTTKGESNLEEEQIYECIQKGELHIEKYPRKLYRGELLHYMPNGKGTLYKYIYEPKIEIYKKILEYCGDFVKGKYQGNGILYYDFKNKNYYEGEFLNNLRHGKGKYYEKNKLVYEGEFAEDKYNGKGKIYYENGGYYDGEFSKGVRNGEGVQYSPDNIIVDEGDFENDTPPIQTIIKKLPSNCSIGELNNNLNTLLFCGRGILQIFGMNTNFICNNCKCNTDDHFLIKGTNIWKCHRCNQECINNPLQNYFG